MGRGASISRRRGTSPSARAPDSAPASGGKAPRVEASPEHDHLPLYSWDEIRRHNNADDCWIVIRQVVYDVSTYADKHPGGRTTLNTAAGGDATSLFETSHWYTDAPRRILEKYAIGRVDTAQHDIAHNWSETATPFWNDLVTEVRAYFKRTGHDIKDWRPALVFFGFLLSMYAVGLVGFLAGDWRRAVLLGVARAMIGVHTMHAASHFAVSHSPAVWRGLNWFCFDVLMGGSSLQWDYQHIMGHHQHTNVYQADPDLPVMDGDIRRLVEEQKWFSPYRYQHIYLPVAYCFLALKTRVDDLKMVFGWAGDMNGPIPMNVNFAQRVGVLCTKLLFYAVHFALPIFGAEALGVGAVSVAPLELRTWIACYLAMEFASGAWLAFFFQVSHLSDELDFPVRDGRKRVEWAQHQCETTVDYGHGSWLLTAMSGSLNYQVTHHLFPSVSPYHYPAIAPIICRVAEKHGIKYPKVQTYAQALGLHLAYLKRMGEGGNNMLPDAMVLDG